MALKMCRKDPNCYGVSARYCDSDYDYKKFMICSSGEDHVRSEYRGGCIYRKGSYPQTIIILPWYLQKYKS